MKKILFIVAVLAAVGAMLAVTHTVAAQGAGGRRFAEPLTLEGPGSSIGVSVRDLSTQEAEKSEGGVLIENVREGSPAARAGFRSGDLVVEFDGERIRSARQFTRVVRETRPDRAVRAVVVRGGSRETVTVTPETRSAADLLPGIAREVERELRRLPRELDFDFDFDRLEIQSRGRLGATLSTLTPQLAEYFGVKEGLLVSSVAEGSMAAAAGLRAGDAIVSVGGAPVRSAADVTRALRRAEPGSTIEMRVVRERKEVTLSLRAPEARTPPVRPRGRTI